MNRVLVVEQDALIVAIYSDLFEDSEFEVVHEVRRWQDAVGEIDAIRPSLVILDYSPESPFYQDVILKCHDLQIPFVLATAYYSASSRFDHAPWLRKPFGRRNLLRIARDALE